MDADGHMNDFNGGIEISWDNLVKGAMKLIKEERKSCAKVCEERAKKWETAPVPMYGFSGELYAAVADIKARGLNEEN